MRVARIRDYGHVPYIFHEERIVVGRSSDNG